MIDFLDVLTSLVDFKVNSLLVFYHIKAAYMPLDPTPEPLAIHEVCKDNKQADRSKDRIATDYEKEESDIRLAVVVDCFDKERVAE